ncbi:MAG TPA: hypothetical protein VKE98_00690, partial [Gemmataceae bacterium]|nr:hypothetical protein [Gemmataceae bacterium]
LLLLLLLFSSSRLCYNLRRVPHLLQFLDNALHPSCSDQQHPPREPADNILGQLLVGQKLFGQHSVFSLDQ